ncbi:MAG: hypothetical protein ACYDAK_08360 [Candidatus Limnocylindrales bacterium]
MLPDDPADHSDEIVGSWLSIDFWLFIAAAMVVGVQHLRSIDGASLETVPLVLSAVAAVTVVLLPTALLWRARDAARTHRLLLAGLAAGAVSELLRAVISYAPLVPDGAPMVRTVLDLIQAFFGPLAGLLVGLGLVRLRTARITRVRVLVAIAATYVAFDVGSSLIVFGNSQLHDWVNPLTAVLLVIRPLAAAFAVWVPVAAWFDDEAPRAFWGLLALALPLSLLSRLIELPQAIVVVALRSNALFFPATTISAIVGAIVALLALVAFARETRDQPGTPATTPRISVP